MVFNVCVKFHENMSSGFKIMERTQKFLHRKSNNSESMKTRVTVICSAGRLMVFNVCVKFHENMSSGFKIMERTRKLLTHKRAKTPKEGKSELPFMCSACRLMVFKVFVKFHENMSRGFKIMEGTRKLLTHKGQ